MIILDREQGAVKQVKQNFKMVTFSLGGKDYGIDIMKVKEIAKFTQFTYVPNTSPFVRGVYNLRGEIISVIDLRIFFHLSAERRKDGIENGLILRLDDYLIGVIVDSIDKVVGFDSANIQPPHPIFGDVNIKYISGVVEHNNTLYLILDVEKLFGKDQITQKIPVLEPTPVQTPIPSPGLSQKEESLQDQTEKSFIRETLKTFKSFHVSPVNEQWIDERFIKWKELRGKQGRDLQIKAVDEADEFLESFYSYHTNTLWADDLAASFLELIKGFSGRVFSIWNPGCGKGFETYSIAALFLHAFPDGVIKIWAMDNDLLSISTAPNLILPVDQIPQYMLPHTVRGKQGISISSQLKERIFFEYHDVLHVNVVPECDIIVARDLVSFLPLQNQVKVLEEYHTKLKPYGVLILGNNEGPIDASLWERVPNKDFSAFKKHTE